MAWLAIHLGKQSEAHDYVRNGISLEPENIHLQRLAARLDIQYNI